MREYSVLAVLSLIALSSTGATSLLAGSRFGRALQSTTTQTLQVGVASLIDTGSKIDVCKVDVTKKQSCGDFLGNTLPCTLSPGYRGVMNYTVQQGDSLTVNFSTNKTSTVIMGGSLNGGFAEDAPCEVQGLVGPAPTQPIAKNTITGFTFAPSRAVCPTFRNNTEGTLAVYMFDSATGSMNGTGGDYLANACIFTINLTIERAADAEIKPEQFYYAYNT